MLTGLAVLCDFVPEVSIPQGATSRRRTVMETMPTWLPEDTSQVHNTHTSLSLTHPRVGEQNTILVLTKRGLEKRIPSQFRVCPGRVPLCRVGTSSRPPSSFMPSCTRGPGLSAIALLRRKMDDVVVVHEMGQPLLSFT